MNTTEASDAPPAYEEATNQTRNGIPPQSRRSMEDEHRPLPQGWIRQFDADTHHQFFVDTSANPPRSIWSHPYDDEQYLNSLSTDERHHIKRLTRSVSLKDIEAESSDDEDHGHSAAAKGVPASSSTGASDQNPKGIHKFGRKMKDRLTNSTHAEREKDRAARAREEQEIYKAHLAFRQAMSKALETGEPQFVGKDRNGRDIYIEPPQGMMRGSGMMIPQGGRVPAGAMGYNPYSQGPYGNPNVRYLRPQQPYYRGPGYGYGGGYGFPLMGGLLGGAMLGGLMF
ncbi:hypothetical protein E2P81_ATG11339 [Venturia nashicola]|uniref:WW domain-containing protein n=1 Tax=Venturia nashicola TaxID=86259 RepID=A0A4Z1P0Y8_9PEZI|nr:hypothetical protein E6O75_ATG11027 [Venturia nashicola]TLD35220.1 hypothetical protein E2P81_ATG11339 [Venturia nashicola]